jgi:hypothetical protein
MLYNSLRIFWKIPHPPPGGKEKDVKVEEEKGADVKAKARKKKDKKENV